MKIKFDKEFNEKIKDIEFSDRAKEELDSARRWSSMVEVEFRCFTSEDLDKLYEVADKEGNRSVKVQINSYRNVVNNSDSVRIKNLQLLEEGLKSYFEKDSIRYWIYKEVNGQYLPYLIKSIKYSEGRDSDDPATVTISGVANGVRESERNKCIATFFSSVVGKTIPQILADNGLVKETQEMIDKSLEEARLCLEYRDMVHREFVVTGEPMVSSWRDDIDYLNNDRCVNDEDLLKRRVEFNTTEHCWGDKILKVPVHPYVYLFSLSKHKNFYTHVNTMTPYVYNDSLKDKLVLPKVHSDLLDILTNDSVVLRGDIIQGKSGGTTILCCGGPGLGKTLTAECYSEITHKPLYKVTSGQLGTSPSEVEKNLEEILKRASRWGAVMLIDEADTYIRARGNDIMQNAIVAAFLRTLEYFDGLLFMTTNRYNDVDDAIVSRCIATITYESPSEESRYRIWSVLSSEFNLEISNEDIETLTKLFSSVSGRDIKELLKLTGRYIKSKGIEDRDGMLRAFISCSQFRSITINEELANKYIGGNDGKSNV